MTQSKSKATNTDWKALLAEDADLMRELVRHVMQEILEAEMTEALGAGPGERTDTRLGYRAGYYPRTLVTRVGKLELRVPRDRDGRFSTELFERYQRSEKALVSALAEMGGRELALESAMNYRFLRKEGVTVRKTIDVMTGTFCIRNDISLLHSDKDFETMQKYLKLKTVAL